MERAAAHMEAWGAAVAAKEIRAGINYGKLVTCLRYDVPHPQNTHSKASIRWAGEPGSCVDPQKVPIHLHCFNPDGDCSCGAREER